jgi:hypothetical protein
MLKVKECELRMKVLLTHPDPSYVISEINPLVGTQWECEGSVVRVAEDHVDVLWKNGFSNSYKNNELSISDTGSGVCVDMWRFL